MLQWRPGHQATGPSKGLISLQEAAFDVLMRGQATGVGMTKPFLDLGDETQPFDRILDRGVLRQALDRLYRALLLCFRDFLSIH